jgi:hypothetical protein
MWRDRAAAAIDVACGMAGSVQVGVAAYQVSDRGEQDQHDCRVGLCPELDEPPAPVSPVKGADPAMALAGSASAPASTSAANNAGLRRDPCLIAPNISGGGP